MRLQSSQTSSGFVRILSVPWSRQRASTTSDGCASTSTFLAIGSGRCASRPPSPNANRAAHRTRSGTRLSATASAPVTESTANASTGAATTASTVAEDQELRLGHRNRYHAAGLVHRLGRRSRRSALASVVTLGTAQRDASYGSRHARWEAVREEEDARALGVRQDLEQRIGHDRERATTRCEPDREVEVLGDALTRIDRKHVEHAFDRLEQQREVGLARRHRSRRVARTRRRRVSEAPRRRKMSLEPP